MALTTTGSLCTTESRNARFHYTPTRFDFNSIRNYLCLAIPSGVPAYRFPYEFLAKYCGHTTDNVPRSSLLDGVYCQTLL